MSGALRPALRVGDRVRDNDPRMPGRVMEVIKLKDGIATLGSRWGNTKVSVARIHTDSKPRRSGWSVVR